MFTTIKKFSNNKISTEKLQSLIKWDYESKRVFGPKIKKLKSKLNTGSSTTDLNETFEYEYIENYKDDKLDYLKKEINLTKIKAENLIMSEAIISKEAKDINLKINKTKVSSLDEEYENLFNVSLYYDEIKEDRNKLILPKFSYRPSVSRILQETMPEESKQNLKQWEDEMILKHGQKGFEKIKQDTFVNGSNLHSNIQSYILNGIFDNLNPENSGHWNSIKPVLDQLENVEVTELGIQHQVLNYKGIIDCVANYEKKNYLIDWKTSKRKKMTLSQTYDNPLQLIAYLGAFNHSYPSNQIDNCMLVISYDDGSSANILKMNSNICLKYWQLWLQRIKEFWMLYEKNN